MKPVVQASNAEGKIRSFGRPHSERGTWDVGISHMHAMQCSYSAAKAGFNTCFTNTSNLVSTVLNSLQLFKHKVAYLTLCQKQTWLPTPHNCALTMIPN
jgi:hypothetical protein